jgi:hypothetical protein
MHGIDKVIGAEQAKFKSFKNAQLGAENMMETDEQEN